MTQKDFVISIEIAIHVTEMADSKQKAI